MPPKKYRLETVLTIRAAAKTEAARQVAARLEKLARDEKELNRRQSDLQACFERQNSAQAALREDLTKVSPNKKILAHKNYLRDLKNQEDELQAAVEQQKQTVARAEREVEAARTLLIEAAREMKAIEVHKESWQSAESAAASRREQKLSDEIGSILHGLRRKAE